MSLHPTLQALADQARQAAHEYRLDEERKQARCAWVRQTIADHKAAQARADEAWRRLIADHPEADDEELDERHPPEQDEADAIWAQLAAARDQDRWPKHLYWSA